MNTTVTIGTKCWLPARPGDKEVWTVGEVVSRKGQVIRIQSEDGSISKLSLDDVKGAKKKKKNTMDVKEPQLLTCNSTVEDDMTSLHYFHVPGILYNIKARSLDNKPYTFLSGNVLVAVNPLKSVKGDSTMCGDPNVLNVPHPFAVAESAYQQMVFGMKQKDQVDGFVNQSIVVGGESGAGKSTCAKFVLSHFVKRCEDEERDFDRRLLDSNPILEAFGNASTLRNPNSSRFGKFLKLHFSNIKKGRKASNNARIVSASVTTYLLERSRVTHHESGERTYHIFYQLVHGADKKLKKKLKLHDTFSFLNPSSTHGGGKTIENSRNMPSVDEDSQNYQEVCNALATVDVSADDVFSIVAAILHLGDVTFKNKNSSEGDVASISNSETFEFASELLGLKSDKLSDVITKIKMKTIGEEIIKNRDKDAAKYALNAVVKCLYIGVFEWLVKRVTDSLQDGNSTGEYFIGVLDIFGFERFQVNDFEQLLINYTNEVLQNCFNHHVFQGEQELYRQEGLALDQDMPAPPDNSICTELLEGKNGLLPMIDAEGKNPQASDEKLNAAMQRSHKGHEYFPRPHPKDARTCFIVKHFSGNVTYTVGKFLEKNSDKVPAGIKEVFGKSNLNIVQEIGKLMVVPESKKAATSVVSKFTKEMKDLVESLNSTQCSFIRCVKPNASMIRDKKSDDWFDNSYIIPQLENLSIPQTAEVLRLGFPTRIPFSLFVKSYQDALPKGALRVWKRYGNKDEQLFLKAIFSAFGIPQDDFVVGRTRVFFKAGMLDEVNEMLKGAVNGDGVDEATIKKFTCFFARIVWRRVIIKQITVNHFLKSLERSRDKAAAATIIQRLAIRRMEILEAQEELARLKQEKAKKHEASAKQREKEQRKRAKQLKEQQLHARDAKEVQQLRVQAAIADNKALEEEGLVNASRIDQEGVSKEIGKLQEQIKKEKKNSTRLLSARNNETMAQKFRKSTAFSRRGQAAEVVQDESENTSFVTSSVRFREIKQNPTSFLGNFSNKKKNPPREDVSRPTPSVTSLMCFTKLFRKKQPDIVQLNEDSNKEEISPEMSERADNEWTPCFLAIYGYQVRVFRETDFDVKTKKKIGKGDPIYTVQVDFFTKAAQLNESIVELRKPKAANLEFEFDDEKESEQFVKQFEANKRRHLVELEENEKFYRGVLDTEKNPFMEEYRLMLANKIISREEYDVVLAQQVTTEDQYAEQDVGLYGEDGYIDYKVQCGSCFTMLFNLPTDPLACCPNCGSTEFDSPEFVEKEAIIARAVINEERLKEFQLLDGRSRDSFPFYISIGNEKYIFDPPEMKSRRNSDGRTIRQFQMNWQRKVGSGDDFDAFVMVSDWKSIRKFRSELVKMEAISDSMKELLPALNEDLSRMIKSQKQEAEFEQVKDFLLGFLKIVNKTHAILLERSVINFLQMDIQFIH